MLKPVGVVDEPFVDSVNVWTGKNESVYEILRRLPSFLTLGANRPTSLLASQSAS